MLLCSVERVERWLVRPGSRACSVPGPSSPCAFVSFFRSPPDPVPHNAPAGAEGSKLADKADVQSSRCLIMSHARHLATIHDLEDAAFGLYRGVGSLIENPPHVAVALRRAVAVVHSGALLVARAYPHPRRPKLSALAHRDAPQALVDTSPGTGCRSNWRLCWKRPISSCPALGFGSAGGQCAAYTAGARRRGSRPAVRDRGRNSEPFYEYRFRLSCKT